MLLERIEVTVKVRPSYGYRRMTAPLNPQKPLQKDNHKRVYRFMKRAHASSSQVQCKAKRLREGELITLATEPRRCSGASEQSCSVSRWDPRVGRRVRLGGELRDDLEWVRLR